MVGLLKILLKIDTICSQILVTTPILDPCTASSCKEAAIGGLIFSRFVPLFSWPHFRSSDCLIPREFVFFFDHSKAHGLVNSYTLYLTASLSLVFKSLKPPASYTLNVQPTDTISAIKSQLAALPSAPPADAQRLLLKGKALADGKLLKEYSIKDGDTLNLVIKPGANWDPTAPPSTTTTTDASMATQSKGFGSGTLDPNPKTSAKGKHGRIPSVVLSPSPTPGSPNAQEKDILLTAENDPVPDIPLSPDATSTYHQTISKPEFWQKLLSFLQYVAILSPLKDLAQ